MKKIILTAIILSFSLGRAYASNIETLSPTPTGSWNFQSGNVYVGTPVLSTETANKAYVDAASGDNLGNHTATTTLTMNGYDINTSSGITGLKRIVWDDGTVQVSSPTVGVGNGGQPDIKFSYMGDMFNSTSSWVFNPIVSAYAFTTARYDIDIGSKTSTAGTVRFAKKSFGGSYVAFQDVVVPVGVSSHTFVGAAVDIADGDIIIWGVFGVGANDPFGDITPIIRN